MHDKTKERNMIAYWLEEKHDQEFAGTQFLNLCCASLQRLQPRQPHTTHGQQFSSMHCISLDVSELEHSGRAASHQLRRR